MSGYSRTVVQAVDGLALTLHVWRPAGSPRAAIQIAHGMAEHALRYARFASALADAGFIVFADDRRGHGATAPTPADLGHLADEGGWDLVLDDLRRVRAQIGAAHPGLPVVFFGHSMGSFLGQALLASDGAAYRGFALCASNGPPRGLASVGRYAAWMEMKRLGPRAKSPLLTRLSFGEFNKRFAPTRTDFDWLSRDPAEVDAYVADPLCGFEVSTAFWRDLLFALPTLAAPEALARLPKSAPVLIVGGDRDPVSTGGRGLEALHDLYRGAGLGDVTLKLYPGARHEILNETNRAEVTTDLLAWFGRVTE